MSGVNSIQIFNNEYNMLVGMLISVLLQALLNNAANGILTYNRIFLNRVEECVQLTITTLLLYLIKLPLGMSLRVVSGTTSASPSVEAARIMP